MRFRSLMEVVAWIAAVVLVIQFLRLSVIHSLMEQFDGNFTSVRVEQH